ncbi:hypothetical protein BO71DRAFT_363789 [Aspergillus ellipticus CBS 707.79]|uniref:Uncharacterized protein n=1 Tax=Aspergillus ellipticus CBS 707.79 TaxID=1448320 RepID=A0A319CX66_9EURO|nr:hypothetical protein BO71DRAFT_363789 [Aspergillus ellipticus CBS 707.79]
MVKLTLNIVRMINLPSAHPKTTPAPREIEKIFEKIQQGARTLRVDQQSWLALAAATTITLNSGPALSILFNVATKDTPSISDRVLAAETIREIGLKCIPFNGMPRTINALRAFQADLPEEIVAEMNQEPRRGLTQNNIHRTNKRGRKLWDQVHRPRAAQRYNHYAKLHPDLPVVVVENHFGALLSDPGRKPGASVGRLTMSVIAIACLRAQLGTGSQLHEHVLGLKKAVVDGTWADNMGDAPERGAKWLASQGGIIWMLRWIDNIRKEVKQTVAKLKPEEKGRLYELGSLGAYQSKPHPHKVNDPKYYQHHEDWLKQMERKQMEPEEDELEEEELEEDEHEQNELEKAELEGNEHDNTELEGNEHKLNKHDQTEHKQIEHDQNEPKKAECEEEGLKEDGSPTR